MSCLSLFKRSRSGSQNGNDEQARPTLLRAASTPAVIQYAGVGTSAVPSQAQNIRRLLEKRNPTQFESLDDSHGQAEYLQGASGSSRDMGVNVAVRPGLPKRGRSAQSVLGMGYCTELDSMGERARSAVEFGREEMTPNDTRPRFKAFRSGSSSSISSIASGRGALKRPELPTIPDQQPLQEIPPVDTCTDVESHLARSTVLNILPDASHASQLPPTTPETNPHTGRYIQVQDFLDQRDGTTISDNTAINPPKQGHSLPSSSTPSTPSEKPVISPFNADPQHNLRGCPPFNGTNSAATTPSVVDPSSSGYFGPDPILKTVPPAPLRTTSTSASLKPGTTATVFLPVMGSSSGDGNVAGSGDSQPIKVELHFDRNAREAHFTASTYVGEGNKTAAFTQDHHQVSAMNQDLAPESSRLVPEPSNNLASSISPGFTVATPPTPPITNPSTTSNGIPEVHHFHQHHHFLLSSAPSVLSDQISPISLVATSTPACEQAPSLRTPSKMPSCYNFPQTPPSQPGPHVPAQVPDQYFPQASSQPPLQLPISMPVQTPLQVSSQAVPLQSYFQLPIQPTLQAASQALPLGPLQPTIHLPSQPPTPLERPLQQSTPEQDHKIEFCHDGHGGGSYQPVPILTPLSETIPSLPESTSLKKEKREKAVTEKKRIALRRAASIDASKATAPPLQSDAPSEYEWDDPKDHTNPFLNPRKSLDNTSIDSWDAIDRRDEESIALARRERHRAVKETKFARARRKGKGTGEASSHRVWDGGGGRSRRRSCGGGSSRPGSVRSGRNSSADTAVVKKNSDGSGDDEDGHCTLDCDGESCHLIESMEVRAEEVAL